MTEEKLERSCCFGNSTTAQLFPLLEKSSRLAFQRSPPKPPCPKTALSAQRALVGQAYSSSDTGFGHVKQEGPIKGPFALGWLWGGTGSTRGSTPHRASAGSKDHAPSYACTSPICCTSCSGSYLLSSAYHRPKRNSLGQGCVERVQSRSTACKQVNQMFVVGTCTKGVTRHARGVANAAP